MLLKHQGLTDDPHRWIICFFFICKHGLGAFLLLLNFLEVLYRLEINQIHNI